jgi:hypothetical protein
MDEFGVAVHADCQRLRRREKKPAAKTPKRFLFWRKTFQKKSKTYAGRRVTTK